MDAPEPPESSRVARAGLALERIVSAAPCPACGLQVDWLEPPREYLVDRGGPAVAFLGTPGIEAVVRICSRCGFVRAHAMRVLDRQPEAGPHES